MLFYQNPNFFLYSLYYAELV